MLAMVVLSRLALFTYIVFPAMPPWMAGQLGYIPPVHRILAHAVGSFASPVFMPTLCAFFGANEVAAVPPLHAPTP